MKTRFAWLSAVVAVAAVVSVVGAADQPSAAPAREGTIVRPARENLRVEDMTDAELQQRLGEWEASKRDARNEYIILNQRWFNYQAQGSISTPIFWAISKVSAGAESAVAGGVR